MKKYNTPSILVLDMDEDPIMTSPEAKLSLSQSVAKSSLGADSKPLTIVSLDNDDDEW